jgi:hypothetical protein
MPRTGEEDRMTQVLAVDASVEFAGALLRPHAYAMMTQDRLTPDGAAVLQAVERAGGELVEKGQIGHDLLDAISRPLLSREDATRQLSN